MARSHIDVVLANSEAFSRCDADAMLELYAPDAVVTDCRQVGWGEFRGHDALRSYYQGLFDNVAALHEDLAVISERGDTIVASCELSAQLVDAPAGDEVAFTYVLRIELVGGLIASIEIYEDAQAAAASI